CAPSLFLLSPSGAHPAPHAFPTRRSSDLSYLREKNCELLERGEELYDIVDDPALFYVPRADAGPSDEAPVATPSRTILAERQRALREETARRCSRLALSQ